MGSDRRGLDRAAEERPWLVGMALGVPAGLLLALFGWLPGDATRTTAEAIFGGVLQGLVIGAIVAFGGSWRRRWRADVERAQQRRRGTSSEAEDPDTSR